MWSAECWVGNSQYYGKHLVNEKKGEDGKKIRVSLKKNAIFPSSNWNVECAWATEFNLKRANFFMHISWRAEKLEKSNGINGMILHQTTDNSQLLSSISRDCLKFFSSSIFKIPPLLSRWRSARWQRCRARWKATKHGNPIITGVEITSFAIRVEAKSDSILISLSFLKRFSRSYAFFLKAFHKLPPLSAGWNRSWPEQFPLSSDDDLWHLLVMTTTLAHPLS